MSLPHENLRSLKQTHQKMRDLPAEAESRALRGFDGVGRQAQGIVNG